MAITTPKPTSSNQEPRAVTNGWPGIDLSIFTIHIEESLLRSASAILNSVGGIFRLCISLALWTNSGTSIIGLGKFVFRSG